MISVAFDPLAASKAFQEAGLDERQAEAIASAMRQAAADRSDMATQADMVALKSDIGVQSVDIAALRTDITALESSDLPRVVDAGGGARRAHTRRQIVLSWISHTSLV